MKRTSALVLVIALFAVLGLTGLPRQPLALPVHIEGRIHHQGVDQRWRRLPLPSLRGDAEVDFGEKARTARRI